MLIDKISPHGGDIYKNRTIGAGLDFSANVNAFGVPPAVIDAVRGLGADAISRYPDPYCTRLRRALSEWYGGSVDPDCILCGNGASELIYAFAFALAKEAAGAVPAPALIVSPAFCEYESALFAAGVPVEYYDMRESDGFSLTRGVLKFDLERYSAVFVCSPNNPTGLTVDAPLVDELAARCSRLFFDVCFLSLSDCPDEYDIPSLIRRNRSLAVLDTFTKSHGMAGLRLGWCISSDAELLSAMSEMSPCWNVSAAAQAAGIAAACEREWLTRTRTVLCREREYMRRRLESLGVYVYPGRANYLLMRSDAPLCGALLEKYHILVRSCGSYRGLDGHYIRAAVKEREQNERLIAAIEEITKEAAV